MKFEFPIPDWRFKSDRFLRLWRWLVYNSQDPNKLEGEMTKGVRLFNRLKAAPVWKFFVGAITLFLAIKTLRNRVSEISFEELMSNPGVYQAPSFGFSQDKGGWEIVFVVPGTKRRRICRIRRDLLKIEVLPSVCNPQLAVEGSVETRECVLYLGYIPRTITQLSRHYHQSV